MSELISEAAKQTFRRFLKYKARLNQERIKRMAKQEKRKELTDKQKFERFEAEVRKVVEPFLEEFYGEKCSTFEILCDCCKKWKYLEGLVKNPFKDDPE